MLNAIIVVLSMLTLGQLIKYYLNFIASLKFINIGANRFIYQLLKTEKN